MKMRCFWLVGIMMYVMGGSASAQKYHALQASSYAGALSVHENAAGLVASPFRWDLSILGLQVKSNTNAYTILDYSLVSNPQKSSYLIDSGYYRRYVDMSANVNLLNARIALGRHHALAFGVNMKSYTNLAAGPYNFIDTLGGTGDFFKINNNNPDLAGNGKAAGWAEIYAAYARTLVDNSRFRLNAGITLKAARALAGGYLDIANSRVTMPSPGIYEVTGQAAYGYHHAFDQLGNGQSAFRSMWQQGQLSWGADVGVELLVKPRHVVLYQQDDYYDYDWKFGLSMLDMGKLTFRYGAESRRITEVLPGVTNAVLDDKFQTIGSLAELNDSIATLATMTTLTGNFSINRPARLLVTADRYLGNYFYVSGSLVLAAARFGTKNSMELQESELLTIVPRREKKSLGLYLPVQVSTRGRLWIGSAVRIGPLLLGLHNMANVFAKNKMQRGGGYLAIHLRPREFIRKKYDKRLDCPPL